MVSKIVYQTDCNKSSQIITQKQSQISMSQDASFAFSSTHKTRGNRSDSPTLKQQKDKQSDLNESYDDRLHSKDDQKIVSKSDTSFFQNDDDDNGSNDKTKKPDTISEKSEDDEELTPDKSNINDESNWDIDLQDNDDDKKIQKEQTKTESRGRGNRDDQNEKQKQPSGTFLGSRKINQDHQLPTEQTGPKKRGNRNTLDKPYEKGFGGKPSYRDEEQSGGYNRSYNNNRQGGYRGGYRGGGYRGGHRGGYRGGIERDYNSQKQDQNSQNSNNRVGESENESTYKPFQKKGRFYEDKNSSFGTRDNQYRGYNNDYSGGYRGRQPQVVQKIVQKIVQKVVEKEVIKYEKLPRPTGIRVQPSVSMYIKGCKLALTCRRLQDFEGDVLIIPYKTPKLELYPGYFVNSCEVNYKQKIKEKGAKLLQEGKLVYMQKCIGQNKFKAFAFLNVADAQTNIKAGIKQVLENVKKISQGGPRYQSVVFPISTQLGQSKTVLNTLVKEIENFHSIVRDVYVLTEEYKAFCEAVTKFNEIFMELYEENELS